LASKTCTLFLRRNRCGFRSFPTQGAHPCTVAQWHSKQWHSSIVPDKPRNPFVPFRAFRDPGTSPPPQHRGRGAAAGHQSPVLDCDPARAGRVRWLPAGKSRHLCPCAAPLFVFFAVFRAFRDPDTQHTLNKLRTPLGAFRAPSCVSRSRHPATSRQRWIVIQHELGGAGRVHRPRLN
jgi:hypothetical protein